MFHPSKRLAPTARRFSLDASTLLDAEQEERIVKCILLTGMSAVGKSTLVAELQRRGIEAVDLDHPDWSERGDVDEQTRERLGVSPGADWVWREERVDHLLRTADTDVLVVAGCAPNQGRFYPHFDQVVLLTAPVDVTIQRLTDRTTNDFGRRPEEMAKVLADKQRFEPLLRDGADVEIDTSAPLESVLRQLLELIRD